MEEVTRKEVAFYILGHMDVLGVERGLEQVSNRLEFTKEKVLQVYEVEKRALEKKKYSKVAEFNNISKDLFLRRIGQGWDMEDAANIPFGKQRKTAKRTAQGQ